MRRLPIRVRVTLPFVVVMAIVLGAMSLFVYLRVGSALLSSVDTNLHAQLGEMTGRVERGTSLSDRDAGGAAAIGQVELGDGTVIRSSPPNLTPLLSADERRRVLAGKTLRWNAEVDDLRGSWRFLAARVRLGQGERALVVGASLAPRDEALDRLARELFIGAPLALVLAALAGYLLTAAALGPVEAMRARAAAITPSTQGQRLPVPDTRDELSRLASTLNAMLSRLEAAFEHERRFVADASHELRTPLALLRTELELALRRPRTHDELERAVRSAAEETERLTQLAEDLLLIARSDQGRLPVRAEALQAQPLLDTVAERFSGVAAERGRSIRVVRDDDVHFEADRIRVEQAIGNLVANALAHGEGTVQLSARREGNAVAFHVTDEGPGFAEDFVARAFDRFSRADDARPTGGTGLGLAIVDLIAKAHGGSVGLECHDGQGPDVWISLPLRAADPKG